ncbi:hypothetical protein GCM10025864_38940 [Luteimicrobium album]|uniref:tRNA synthetases class I catalytic domain-containing protein n=1 Tax=Luteimicrobium album TaxID=1054550 RepID=A0ABQ6I6J8_9MICO|nr:hypothetical protein GCM10025864_38940 [Luteimicrobium album]
MHSWPAPQIPALPSPPDAGPDGPAEIRVRDSSTGGLVVAAPGPHARMYVCGITPYDATHLGHAATYVAFDLLQRAWRDAGKKVTYASNVTDVDDPLLERADATGVDWRELAAAQTALFAEDMAALGVIPPDVYVGAVETVPDVVRAVSELVASGAAYRVPLEDGAGETGPTWATCTPTCPSTPISERSPAWTATRCSVSSQSGAGTPTVQVSATPSTRSSGGANGRVSPRGTAVTSAPGAPAGTSSAPSSAPTASALGSTSRAAASTCCSRTTRCPARTCASCPTTSSTPPARTRPRLRPWSPCPPGAARPGSTSTPPCSPTRARR